MGALRAQTRVTCPADLALDQGGLSKPPDTHRAARDHCTIFRRLSAAMGGQTAAQPMAFNAMTRRQHHSPPPAYFLRAPKTLWMNVATAKPPRPTNAAMSKIPIAPTLRGFSGLALDLELSPSGNSWDGIVSSCTGHPC